MITAKPTKNLTGILIEGEFDDFYELVDCIYRMTGDNDDYHDPYWSIKNRLLGVCYDIRHAFQGDRTVRLVDNGVHDDLMQWHSMVMPKQNVHYAVEILFPEAVFVALSIPDLYLTSGAYYGSRARNRKKKESEYETVVYDYADYLKDQAMLNLFSSVVLSALAKVIGDEEFEKIMRQKQQYDTSYEHYVTQYVDKCNIEYMKTQPDKRKDKLRNIARRLAKKPGAYNNMQRTLEAAAREYGCSIHELHDSRMDYPEEIEW